MLRFTRRTLLAMGFAVLVGMVSVFVALDILPYAFASPLSQFPTNSVTIISDPPPPDLPGQFSEHTLLQDNFWDPGGSPLWRSGDPNLFDDSSWQASYPVVRQPAWGLPVGMAPPVDFIWGGSPGAAVGNRFNIPNSPVPQYLFLRKNFCIPINADPNSITAATPLLLQVATTNSVAGIPIPSASVYYNSAQIALGLMGDESGAFYSLPLDPTTVAGVRRVGRNTLAMRVRDNVDDTSAGVAYSLQFDYTIDPSAITVSSNPPGFSVTGATVVFNQSNNGLSGDGPFTFGWDFGDGTTSTDPAPSKVYNAPGTYTVTLVMTDSFGCPSAPVSVQYVVQAPTPTPTNTPTPAPTSAPMPPPAEGPAPPPTPLPTPTTVVKALDVVINEVAWAGTGTDTSPDDEWIELKNNTSQAINLVGWTLVAADGTPNIALAGIIPADGYFLLERTDDNTVSDILADQIYSGELDDAGESLTLRDVSLNVIDTANADGGGWPGGTTGAGSPPYASMERLNSTVADTDANWGTNDGLTRNGLDSGGNPINGTPKAANSVPSGPQYLFPETLPETGSSARSLFSILHPHHSPFAIR